MEDGTLIASEPLDSLSSIFPANGPMLGTAEVDIRPPTTHDAMQRDEVEQLRYERDLWKAVAEDLQRKLGEL